MKNKILALLVGILAVMPVIAVAKPENFGGNGEVWTNDYGEHYVNNYNPNLRFDWTGHQWAVPGQGGHHANDNAAIIPWGSGNLVVNNHK